MSHQSRLQLRTAQLASSAQRCMQHTEAKSQWQQSHTRQGGKRNKLWFNSTFLPDDKQRTNN